MKNSNFLLLATAILALCSTGHAQWVTNPATNTPVTLATNSQVDVSQVSDEMGGAFIVWADYRAGNNSDIYIQHLDASGNAAWTTNGIVVCNATNDQRHPEVVYDGWGGAIISWEDQRASVNDVNIYVQRVDESGNMQWTSNGISVCNASNAQVSLTMTTDGFSGAIMSWSDFRNQNDYNIYAQCIDASGSIQWTTNGLALCTASGNQGNPQVVTNYVGGAVVTWEDFRNGNSDIYAQSIEYYDNGTIQWTADGVVVCNATDVQSSPRIVSDVMGGAIITWQDQRSGTNDIYVQHINYSGSSVWTANGLAICTATGVQDSPSITADDWAGGAMIAWRDHRAGNADIYAQRVDMSGTLRWTTNGEPVCTLSQDVSNPALTTDGLDGAIIAWTDLRNGNNDIYAQRITASGATYWSANGVAIATGSASADVPLISIDISGGAVISWSDTRNSSSPDVYAQNIAWNASLGYVHPSMPLNCTYPYAPTICTGESCVLTACGAGTIEWYSADVGGNFLGSGYQYQTPVLSATTTYYVQDDGSQRRPITVEVVQCRQMQEAQPSISSVFPNPSSGVFSFETAGGIVTVYNSQGEIIQQNTSRPGISTIDLSNESAGIYILHIESDRNEQRIRLVRE
jgi:hypothetical protein